MGANESKVSHPEERRKRIKDSLASIDKPVNILIVGEHGTGKTCLMNTFNCALNDTDQVLAEPGVDFNTGTTHVRRFNIRKNLYCFDVPGMGFRTEQQQRLLLKILDGVEVGEPAEIKWDKSDQDTSILEKSIANLKPNEANRIDHIIWVVNPKMFEKDNGKFIFFEWATADVGARQYYQQLFDTLRVKSKRKFYPRLVFTHCGEGEGSTNLSIDQLMAEFPYVSNSCKHFINNYTDKVDIQRRTSTDKSALALLHGMISQVRALQL